MSIFGGSLIPYVLNPCSNVLYDLNIIKPISFQEISVFEKKKTSCLKLYLDCVEVNQPELYSVFRKSFTVMKRLRSFQTNMFLFLLIT